MNFPPLPMPHPGIAVLSQMFLIEVNDGNEVHRKNHKRHSKDTNSLCVFMFSLCDFCGKSLPVKIHPSNSQQQP
jgi:hypothetical protein